MARTQVIEEPSVKHVTEAITYVPAHGDPPIIQWGGHTFHANMPKEITGHAEGTAREKLNMELIERARDNKHFLVGNAKRQRKSSAAPETADQYRAHFVEWLKDPAIESATQLIDRFGKEREMRLLCEVGGSDYDLLSSLFMPRLAELAKADELNDEQVAAIWRQHGFNELPW